LFLRSLIAKRPVEVFVTQFLVEEEIDSILLIPDTVIKTTMAIPKGKGLEAKTQKETTIVRKILRSPRPKPGWL
jgi:hypothetical protein